MRGLMRFGGWERLWLFTARPLTRPATQGDLSPHSQGEVTTYRIVGMVNSAPSLMPEGQREVTVFVLV